MPCKLCGTCNFSPSLGGPDICPACDCGQHPNMPLYTKRVMGLAPPPTHDERTQADAMAPLLAPMPPVPLLAPPSPLLPYGIDEESR